MKVKLILAIGLLLLLMLPAGLALADNGPHGGYTATTDACAGCHRAHTAAAPRLLVDTMPQLCFTCHGSTATGADTNVEDGVYLNRDLENEVPAEGTPNRGLKGGGFVNVLMDTNFDGAAASAPATSTHLNDGSTGTAWGNGAIGSGPGAANFSLSCASCHDPHGGAGAAGGPTYRILRATPLNSVAPTGVDVPDEANPAYTVANANNQYFGEGYPAPGGGTWAPMEAPDSNLSGWCAQCHTRHRATTGSGSTNSGDAIFAFRHMSQGAPGATCGNCHNFAGGPFLLTTAGPEWHHYVECMTCHVAHGTSASATGFAAGTYDPAGALGPILAGDSSLLRGDNRGVCQRCHGK
ncbi:MAG: cytochrome c3 family protein [Chloroflexota bacterium]